MTVTAHTDTRIDLPPGGDGGMRHLPPGATYRDCGDNRYRLVADLDLRPTDQLIADSQRARAELDAAVEASRAAREWTPDPDDYDGSDWLTPAACCGPIVSVEAVTR